MYKLSWNDFDKAEYVLDEAFLLQELDEKVKQDSFEDIETHLPEIMQALKNGMGLNAFGKKRMLEILKVVQPKNLEELARVYALYDSPDLWEKVVKNLLGTGEVTLDELIVFKEEIYEYLTSLGIESYNAFAIMDYSSEQIGLTDEMKKDIFLRDVPAWVKKMFDNVFYFSRRRTAMACASVAIQLVNYRLYYPELFHATYYDHYIGRNMDETIKESFLFLHQEELERIKEKQYKIPYRVSDEIASHNMDMKNAVELLGILEIETGVDVSEINLDDEKVISIFQSPYGADGTCTSRGIVSLGDDAVMEILQKVKPKTITELEKAYALATNERLWKYIEPVWFQKNIESIDEAMVYREEIYEYLLKQGYRSQEAYRLMSDIRRGIKLSDKKKEELRLHRVPDWQILCWDNTRYFTKREWVQEVVHVAFCLAYYKLNYPKEFYLAYWKVIVNEDYRRLVLKKIDINDKRS